MTPVPNRIGVVPVGKVRGEVPKVVAAHISGYLNLAPEVLPPIGHPRHAFDRRRHQYDAGLILGMLETLPADGVEKVIAVADVDLFVPIFTHVFGEARQGGRAALVSTYRLGPRAGAALPVPPTVLERAAKIALHELCHLYRLSHCTDDRCLMRFSADVDDLDRTPFQFCRYCDAFFREAVGDRG